jgi:hypothetical protein
MALRTSEDDQTNNPGDKDYKDKFVDRSSARDLKEAEKDTKNQNNDDINDSERSPDTSWKNNVSGEKSQQPKNGIGFGKILKQKGPMATILLILAGGGFFVTTLLSPSLLIVQIKEMMVGKFNTQLTSMDVRTTKLLTAKATGGVCGTKISIACKYSSMSAKELKNFEAAGIKVKYDKTTVFGQVKPTEFEFKGKTIKANAFSSTIRQNVEFRTALKTAYNPKFAGFADRIWAYTASKLRISKAKVDISGSSDADRLKKVQDITSEGTTGSAKKVSTNDINPKTNKKYTKSEATAFNEAIDNSLSNVDNIKSSKIKSASSSFGLGAKSLTNAIKVTGIADNACLAYTSIQTLGYAAKTVRTLQLISFAMIFLNLADQIKAGSANPEDVTYAGDVLTKEVPANESEGTAAVKSATDSFGYRYAAYGETGNMPDSSTMFMAAGGLAGSLITVTNTINTTLGGNPKKTCDLLNKPIVIAGSLIVGIASLFVPGVNVGMAAKSAVAAVAFSVAIAAIPAMLQDIVAGVLVDESTVGELAGDALTSGSSGLMGSVASAGGNAPMTPDQAVSYSNLSKEIAAQYAEEDKLTANPFDTTNSNTFIGSIAAQLLPYSSRLSSLSGFISSIASLSLNSLSSIFSPHTKAASEEEYTMCQDYTYGDLNGDGNHGDHIATDPFCNVVYGIPPEYLDIEPLDVITALQKEPLLPQINEETGDPLTPDELDDLMDLSKARVDYSYYKFVKQCINRTEPLGESQNGEYGDNCMIGKNIRIGFLITYNDEGEPQEDPVYINNKYFYLHYIDQRVQKGMDGTDTTLSAALESGRTDISFFDMGLSANTALNNGVSY